MTLLPCEPIRLSAAPGPEYEIPERCANPSCNKLANDKHEIARCSHMSGIKWWVSIDGVVVGNRVGLCRDCEDRVVRPR
jgi:hypothetical protein